MQASIVKSPLMQQTIKSEQTETVMCYLTDGKEIFQSKRMTLDELAEANRLAMEHTDGNIIWTL